MRKTLLILALAAGAARPATAQTDERAAVLAVVQQLWDGMRTKDTALLRTIFAPGARLVSVRPGRGTPPAIRFTPWEEFAGALARSPAVWNERMFDPEVRIDGTLATVWTAYDFHAGTTFSHCGIDALQLLKTGDGWKIVSVADTFQQQGCPTRPPLTNP